MRRLRAWARAWVGPWQTLRVPRWLLFALTTRLWSRWGSVKWVWPLRWPWRCRLFLWLLPLGLQDKMMSVGSTRSMRIQCVNNIYLNLLHGEYYVRLNSEAKYQSSLQDYALVHTPCERLTPNTLLMWQLAFWYKVCHVITSKMCQVRVKHMQHVFRW